jgi:hypothetical protein
MATITMLNSYTGNYMTGKIGSFYELETYKVMDTSSAACGKHYFSNEEEYNKWIDNDRMDLKTLEIERKRAQEASAYDDDYDCLDPDDEVRLHTVRHDRLSEQELCAYLNDPEDDESERQLKQDNLQTENELYAAMNSEKEQRRRGLMTTTTLISGSWADACDSDNDDEW